MQIKLRDPSLTRAIPERFRDEYCTDYKPLHKCPVLLREMIYVQWSSLKSSGGQHREAEGRSIVKYKDWQPQWEEIPRPSLIRALSTHLITNNTTF